MAHRPRVARTSVELQAETKTLAYEFAQLCQSADVLRQGTFGGKGVNQNNTVQGFAIAFGNLACFFFPHASNFPPLIEDDLGAVEYVPDWSARAPAPSVLMRECKEAASKQIMHLTGTRRDLNFVPGNEFNWPIDDLERELLSTLRVFLAATSATQFDPRALADLRCLEGKISAPSGAAITHSGHLSVAGKAPSTNASMLTDARTIAPQPSTSGKTCP
jgi:hypothetical protein